MGNCGAKKEQGGGHPSVPGGKKKKKGATTRSFEELPPDTKADREIKVVLVGDVHVGKSSLLVRFADGSFPQDVGQTIGCDFKTKVIKYNGKIYKLLLWDTAGQERFRTISNSLYDKAEAFILAYDITQKDSFVNVQKQWLVEIDHYATGDIARVLCGLKLDLAATRQVTEDEAREKADEIGVPDYFELSAKTSLEEKVAEPFLRLLALLED